MNMYQYLLYSLCLFLFISTTLVECNSYFRGLKASDIDIESSNKYFEESWFDQRQDHNDPTNLQTYKQRYFMSDEYYQKGGSILIQIGGEGPANAVWLKNGLWTRLAHGVGARLYILEHRYYGKSHPVPNMSTENLKYLSSSQALADLANFIQNITAAMDYKPKVVVWGGSYPASLALWSRYKYPHLIDGAVAASAPLMASADFYQYMDVVLQAIETYGENNCIRSVKAALEQTTKMLGTEDGRKKLKSIYSLCGDINTDYKETANFMQYVLGTVSDVVQYNNDNRAFEGAPIVSISSLCKIMNNQSIGSEIDRYARAITVINHRTKCADITYQSNLAAMKNESWDSIFASSRSWVYQTCTEFGWYQTTDSKKVPGDYLNMTFSYEYCQDVYGQKFNKAVLDNGIYETNLKNGGLHVVKYINQTVLINGDIDPWHVVSFVPKISDQKQVSLNLDSPRKKVAVYTKGDIEPNYNPNAFLALFIPGSAHCAALYPPSITDVPVLLTAREIIQSAVMHWISLP